MKKILLILTFSLSLFAGEVLNDWFNKKYKNYKENLVSVNGYTSYGVTTSNLKLISHNKKEIDINVITNEGGFGTEETTFYECHPNIQFAKGTNNYILKYENYCLRRFSLEGYKHFIDNIMHNISKTVSNVSEGTYNQPIKEKFKVIPERN